MLHTLHVLLIDVDPLEYIRPIKVLVLSEYDLALQWEWSLSWGRMMVFCWVVWLVTAGWLG